PAGSPRCPASRPAARFSGQPGDRPPLLAAGAADPLAEKAGVAQVQRVLLDHVQIDQAQRHDLAVVVQVLRIGWLTSLSLGGPERAGYGPEIVQKVLQSRLVHQPSRDRFFNSPRGPRAPAISGA